MLAKNITYLDFDGKERTETFHFHMMQSEIVEMQVSKEEGYDEFIKRIMATEDKKELIALFKQIILMSYGVRSEDGRGFTKSPELSEAFSHTEAFSNLFMELATDADAAAKFIEGITPAMPKDKLPAKSSKSTTNK